MKLLVTASIYALMILSQSSFLYWNFIEFSSRDVLSILMLRFGSRLFEDCNTSTCRVCKLEI